MSASPRWLVGVGGRKMALSLLLVALSLVVVLLVDTVDQGVLATLFTFWAGLAGVHAGGNVGEWFARRRGGEEDGHAR